MKFTNTLCGQNVDLSCYQKKKKVTGKRQFFFDMLILETKHFREGQLIVLRGGVYLI